MDAEVIIRPFAEQHAAQVRKLFITVNRLLSPPDLRDAFEVYIEHALAEEIDRISTYYGERDGCFWVAVTGDKVVGTFGLERASDDAVELRRMYVDPSARRRGIARRMLQFGPAAAAPDHLRCVSIPGACPRFVAPPRMHSGSDWTAITPTRLQAAVGYLPISRRVPSRGYRQAPPPTTRDFSKSGFCNGVASALRLKSSRCLARRRRRSSLRISTPHRISPFQAYGRSYCLSGVAD